MKCLVLVLVLLAVSSYCSLVSAAENLVGSRFSLCLRESQSANSGKAFLCRNDGTTGVCIYGKYSIDESKSPVQFTFTPVEVWRGSKTKFYEWAHSAEYSGKVNETALRFELSRSTAGVVLTHLPTSDSLDFDVGFLSGLNWGNGEIVEFQSSKKDPFTAEELPPYLSLLSQYKNRLKEKPKTIWGLGLVANSELMFTNSEGGSGRAGYGAIKLIATSEEDTLTGAAWLFYHSLEKQVLLAGRGTYDLGVNTADPQSLLLELRLPRIFQRLSGQGVSSWKTNPYSESGMMIKIPLNDRGVPIVASAYPGEFFFVNADGKRERRFYNHGFLNMEKSELEMYTCVGLGIFSSLQLRPLADLNRFEYDEVRLLYDSLVVSPPPSFSQKSLDASFLKNPPPKPDPRLALKGKPASEYRKFLEANPSDYAIFVEYVKLVPKDDNESLRWGYQQLARLRPDNVEYHLKHSQYAKAVGKGYEATEALKIVAALSKGEEQIANHQRLAKVLFDQKKYKDAYEALDKYVGQKPSDIESHAQLVEWYSLYGNDKWSTTNAIKFVPIANKTKDKAKYGEYLQATAGMYAKLARWSEAIEIEDRLIRERINVRTAKHYRELFLARKDLSHREVYRYWDARSAESGVLGKIIDYQRETLKVQRPDGSYTTMAVSKLSEESLRQLPKEFSLSRVPPR